MRELWGLRGQRLRAGRADIGYGGGGYNNIDGSVIQSPYRAFARDFRKKIWTKLLGDAAGEYSDFLEKPAKAENWQRIR